MKTESTKTDNKATEQQLEKRRQTESARTDKHATIKRTKTESTIPFCLTDRHPIYISRKNNRQKQ